MEKANDFKNLKEENKTSPLQQNIINCGFCADNQGLLPATVSVLFDRKVPRITQQIIFAERLGIRLSLQNLIPGQAFLFGNIIFDNLPNNYICSEYIKHEKGRTTMV
ncbi:MAG: hypothetical protein JXB00_06800 [Bacteroidales bacterium]|nr:hypothetical protein [Bacteroidales bacterium]